MTNSFYCDTVMVNSHMQPGTTEPNFSILFYPALLWYLLFTSAHTDLGAKIEKGLLWLNIGKLDLIELKANRTDYRFKVIYPATQLNPSLNNKKQNVKHSSLRLCVTFVNVNEESLCYSQVKSSNTDKHYN